MSFCALPEFRKSLFEFLICYQDTKYFILHDYINTSIKHTSGEAKPISNLYI